MQEFLVSINHDASDAQALTVLPACLHGDTHATVTLTTQVTIAFTRSIIIRGKEHATACPRHHLACFYLITYNIQESLVPSNHDASFEDICTSFRNGDVNSAVKKIFANTQLRKLAVDQVSRYIDEECSLICRSTDISIFRRYNVGAQNFEWKDYATELKVKSPVLYHILTKIVSHSDKRNSRDTKHHFPGICTSVAILLKERNKDMTGLQTLLSLVLFPSHIQKQVELLL